MCCGGSGSVDLSMRVTAQQDPCLCSIVSERTGSEQHNRRHVTHPSPKRAPCVQSASVNAGPLMHDVCGMLTMFSSRTGWQEDVLHDFHCRRGRVRGCWVVPRADILACVLPLTAPIFSALTFSALLHVCIAWTCSLPGCRARQPRPSCTDLNLYRAAHRPPDSLADMVRRSLRPQSHVGDRSLRCSKGTACAVCSPPLHP